MRNIQFEVRETGEIKNVNVPECIATPVIDAGLAVGGTIVLAFFVGLVKDGVHLVKKLFKK